MCSACPYPPKGERRGRPAGTAPKAGIPRFSGGSAPRSGGLSREAAATPWDLSRCRTAGRPFEILHRSRESGAIPVRGECRGPGSRGLRSGGTVTRRPGQGAPPFSYGVLLLSSCLLSGLRPWRPCGRADFPAADRGRRDRRAKPGPAHPTRHILIYDLLTKGWMSLRCSGKVNPTHSFRK